MKSLALVNRLLEDDDFDLVGELDGLPDVFSPGKLVRWLNARGLRGVACTSLYGDNVWTLWWTVSPGEGTWLDRASKAEELVYKAFNTLYPHIRKFEAVHLGDSHGRRFKPRMPVDTDDLDYIGEADEAAPASADDDDYDIMADFAADVQSGAMAKYIKASIEDYLYDKNWLSVHVIGAGEDLWEIYGTFIDNDHRAYWMNAGARVIGPPDLDNTEKPIHSKRYAFARYATNTFKGAMRRAGWNFSNVHLEHVEPAYTLLDLESVEASDGDVRVVLTFNFIPPPFPDLL